MPRRGNRRKAVINLGGVEMAPGTTPVAPGDGEGPPPDGPNPSWNNRANRRARGEMKKKRRR